MAFIGAFTVAQNSPSTITLTDASTGSDPNITARTITVTKFDNTTIIENYNWPVDAIPGDTITLSDIFDQDYAVNITVVWSNSIDPDPDATYTVTQLYEFDFYAMDFLSQLATEDQGRNPAIVNDTNFLFYKLQFYNYVIQARISVGLMNDIFKAQYNLDKARDMRLNQVMYF